MKGKAKKIDMINRLLVLLDADSLDVLFDESFQEIKDVTPEENERNPQLLVDSDFYGDMNRRVSELYIMRNELELFRGLLEE